MQAGPPPPLLIRADGSMSFIGEGGLPVGLVMGVSYVPIQFTMAPGDRLLLYSDGITEAELKDNTMLEEDGLRTLVGCCLAASGTEFLDDLYWNLSQITRKGTALQDDVSAALVEYVGC